MKKIIFLSILGALFLFVFMYAGAYIIGPGSYARAEYYILDIPEAEFPQKVKKLKEEYPEYKFMRLETDSVSYEYKEEYPEYKFMPIETDSVLYEYKEDYSKYIYYKDYRDYGHKDNDYHGEYERHFYFYEKNTQHLFCCVLRPNGKSKTRLGLYAVFYDTEFRFGKLINNTGKSKRYNDILTREENKKLKKEFETLILDKLGTWKYEKTAVERFLGL